MKHKIFGNKNRYIKAPLRPPQIHIYSNKKQMECNDFPMIFPYAAVLRNLFFYSSTFVVLTKQKKYYSQKMGYSNIRFPNEDINAKKKGGREKIGCFGKVIL